MPGFASERINKHKSSNKVNQNTAQKISNPPNNQRIINDISAASPSGILDLQRTLGNQAVCGLIQAQFSKRLK